MKTLLRECTLFGGCELSIFQENLSDGSAVFFIQINDGNNVSCVDCYSESHANGIYDAFCSVV